MIMVRRPRAMSMEPGAGAGQGGGGTKAGRAVGKTPHRWGNHPSIHYDPRSFFLAPHGAPSLERSHRREALQFTNKTARLAAPAGPGMQAQVGVEVGV